MYYLAHIDKSNVLSKIVQINKIYIEYKQFHSEGNKDAFTAWLQLKIVLEPYWRSSKKFHCEFKTVFSYHIMSEREKKKYCILRQEAKKVLLIKTQVPSPFFFTECIIYMIQRMLHNCTCTHTFFSQLFFAIILLFGATNFSIKHRHSVCPAPQVLLTKNSPLGKVNK